MTQLHQAYILALNYKILVHSQSKKESTVVCLYQGLKTAYKQQLLVFTPLYLVYKFILLQELWHYVSNIHHILGL